VARLHQRRLQRRHQSSTSTSSFRKLPRLFQTLASEEIPVFLTEEGSGRDPPPRFPPPPLPPIIMSTTRLNHKVWLQCRCINAFNNSKSQPTPTMTAHPTHWQVTVICAPPAPPSACISPPALLVPQVLQQHCCRLVPPDLGPPLPNEFPPSLALPPSHKVFLEIPRNDPLFPRFPAGNWLFQGADGFPADFRTSRWQGLAVFAGSIPAGSLSCFYDS
jgi:hypothetical protein